MVREPPADPAPRPFFILESKRIFGSNAAAGRAA